MEDHVKTHWENSNQTVGREVSLETDPTDTLILDFKTPELQESKFPLLKPPVCGILLFKPEQTNTGTYHL